jgi:parvulin-like peptidyl-prolyl isomerase
MKRLVICAVIAGWMGAAAAQVASHEPAKFAAPQEGMKAATTTLATPTGKPVAKVNGVVLTDRDLVWEEYAIFPYAKQHNGTIPQAMEPDIRNGAMQMIVFEELAYQAAKKQGMKVSAEKLAQAQRDFRKRFSSEEEYQRFLKGEYGGEEKLLQQRIERSMLIDQYMKANINQKAAPTEVELKAAYDKSGSRYVYKESYAMQTITIMPPANATAAQLQEAKKRAQDALKEAKATKTPEEFGLLAEKYSDDDYRVLMGDHKWVEKDKIPPQMLQPMLKMKMGQVSDLILVDQYYVIFRYNGHTVGGKYKYAEVKGDLKKELEQKKTEQLRASLNQKLRQGAKIETL